MYLKLTNTLISTILQARPGISGAVDMEVMIIAGKIMPIVLDLFPAYSENVDITYLHGPVPGIWKVWVNLLGREV